MAKLWKTITAPIKNPGKPPANVSPAGQVPRLIQHPPKSKHAAALVEVELPPLSLQEEHDRLKALVKEFLCALDTTEFAYMHSLENSLRHRVGMPPLPFEEEIAIPEDQNGKNFT